MCSAGGSAWITSVMSSTWIPRAAMSVATSTRVSPCVKASRFRSRALVFSRTKHGANRIAEQLTRSGIRTDAIHGNKSQGARQKALEGFRNGQVRVLVATDIAARGLDVEGVSHVINFDLPNEPESYVHRIGRTARAGASGSAISFCDAEETAYLRDIEKVIRRPVPVDVDHPYHAAHIATARAPRGAPARQPSRHQRPGARRGSRGTTGSGSYAARA